VWGGTQFVVVGSGGTVLTSPDGIVWSHRDSGTSEFLNGIAWNGSLFVAVSRFGLILTSPDGIRWTMQPAGPPPLREAVAWGGGQFVVVGIGSAMHTSPDGIDWTQREVGTSLHGVTWSGNQFVAVGEEGAVLTSDDGINWIHRASGVDHLLRSVAWSGDEFVAVGAYYPRNSVILRSPDGITWTRHETGNSAWLEAVAWVGNQFVAVGEGGAILTSPDGSGWSAVSSDTFVQLHDVTWSGSQFAAVGLFGSVVTSPDGIDWTRRDSGTFEHLAALTADGDRLVAVGGNWDPERETETGVILTSEDGISWTRHEPGIDQWLDDVTWNGSQFVAVGGGGTILTSSDSAVWVRRESGIAESLHSVAWNGSRIVAVGSGGWILTSMDAIVWTNRESGTSNQLRGIAWNGSLFVAVGTSDTILTSPDGVHWTTRSSGIGNTLDAVVWGGGQFVVVGTWGTILTSSDGIQWRSRYSGTARWLQGVAWGGDTFVAVGESGTILQSGTISRAPPLPDLVVNDVRAPEVVLSEEAFTVEWTVANQGLADTPGTGWTDAVRLSRDSHWGGVDDIVLGTRPHTAGLDALRNYTVALTVYPSAITGGIPAGEYYVLVSTDAEGVVEEEETGNNTGSAARTLVVYDSRDDVRPSFLSLGYFEGFEAGSEALAVSADGRFVAGRSWSETRMQGVRWDLAGRGEALGFLEGTDDSSANAISADGGAVVGSSGGRAFRWASGEGMIDLRTLPGKEDHVARGVSGDGSIVVGSADPGGLEESVQPFRWTAGGGMVGLGFPEGITRGEAMAISLDGSTIAGWWGSHDDDVAEPFVAGPEDPVPHGLGGIATPIAGVPRAVSNDGSLMVMNYTNELDEVWAYRLTTLSGVEGLGWVEVGVGISGLAMSGDGSVIIGTSRHERAFIWDAIRGVRDLKVELETEHGLHLDGWNLIAANGITVVCGHRGQYARPRADFDAGAQGQAALRASLAETGHHRRRRAARTGTAQRHGAHRHRQQGSRCARNGACPRSAGMHCAKLATLNRAFS
jgi:hypothetical protein